MLIDSVAQESLRPTVLNTITNSENMGITEPSVCKSDLHLVGFLLCSIQFECFCRRKRITLHNLAQFYCINV